MEFGVPNLRNKRENKYDDKAVIIFHPTAEGMGRKMELSEKAIEMLNLTDKNNQVSFSFTGADIYIVNTSNTGVAGLKVGKTTNGFSDKKHYNFIKGPKHYNMPDSDELVLCLVETEQEYNDNKVYKLVKQCENAPCSNHALFQEEDVIMKDFEHTDAEAERMLESDEQGYNESKEQLQA